MYKTLISIVTERTYSFLDANNILPSEQKGCKKGSYGGKGQLLINKMFWKTVAPAKGTLALRIVYRKAFDSVPHTYDIKSASSV